MKSKKIFEWNIQKNYILKNERHISFEEIIVSIKEWKIIDIKKHPNQNKYPWQKVFYINYNDYIYLVPFIENWNKCFLKTIIPSRKYTKFYLHK